VSDLTFVALLITLP